MGDGKMNKAKYSVGKFPAGWGENKAQVVTFVVTEDCNLRCKYCYITHKKANKVMDFNTAKLFIDYLFEDKIARKEAVILEFIGGEPLLEVGLIDEICDYFKLISYEKNDEWYWNYRISISTNGVNYSDEDVQKFVKKNIGKLSIGITIDGTKEKHDLQRVYPSEKGSYDDIMKSIPLWVSQLHSHTKVTFASDDLKYLKESIIELWNMGIKSVAANVVFENVWKEGDDQLFEVQLHELADYIIDNELYNKYNCTLFSDSLGGYYSSSDLNSTYCGAGKMMAIDADGNIFPCIRYKDYSLNNQPEWKIGDLDNNINMEMLRPFVLAMTKYQSNPVCLECEVATGCAFCQGFNYDESPNQTNFYRATHICAMHKARVRANDYYFSRLFNKYGILRDSDGKSRKKLYFLLSKDFATYCSFHNNCFEEDIMSTDKILEGLHFARENFYDPIFVHSKSRIHYEWDERFDNYLIQHYVPISLFDEAMERGLKNCVFVFSKNDLDSKTYTFEDELNHSILNVDMSELERLGELVNKLFAYTKHIDLNIQNLNQAFDEKSYSEQLRLVNDAILSFWFLKGEIKTINVVTSLGELEEHNNCKAGDRTFLYAPNGKLYTCPASYADNEDNSIGDIENGISDLYDNQLYNVNNHPLCQECDAFHCVNCIHLNKIFTNEINVSPSFQCKKSHIEREAARVLQQESVFDQRNEIEMIDYIDPINAFISGTSTDVGFFKQ